MSNSGLHLSTLR